MINKKGLYLGARAHEGLLNDFRDRFVRLGAKQKSTVPCNRMTRDEAVRHIIDQMMYENAEKLAEPHCHTIWELFLETVEESILGFR